MSITLAPTDGRPIRQRILDAAIVAFYRDGIRAVSADKLIAETETTKVTFYRHFRTKDDLVLAYLSHWSGQEKDAVGAALSEAGDDPEAIFDAVAKFIGELSCEPGFRGCPFINAAAEYPDPTSPVRKLVAAHREWFRSALETALSTRGVANAAKLADQLMMIRDGAMVAGYLSDSSRVADALAGAARSILRT